MTESQKKKKDKFTPGMRITKVTKSNSNPSITRLLPKEKKKLIHHLRTTTSKSISNKKKERILHKSFRFGFRLLRQAKNSLIQRCLRFLPSPSS